LKLKTDELSLTDIVEDKNIVTSAIHKCSEIEKQSPKPPSEKCFITIFGYGTHLEIEHHQIELSVAWVLCVLTGLVPDIFPHILPPLADGLAIISMSFGTLILLRHLQLHPRGLE